MRHFIAANYFLFGIVVSFALAALAPEIGSKNGALPIGLLQTVGIAAIFFFQGASLPFEELKRSVSEWKLHLCVQTTTFLFFPLLILTGLTLTASFFIQPDLRLGFLYLSFLPTTIASAIALTATSGGNVSGALFNTTISNVCGVFLVPILCLVLMEIDGTQTQIEIGPVLIGILIKIILPLFIGQACRRFLRNWTGRHKIGIRRFNNGVILFLLYAAFCDSFIRNIWSSVEPSTLTGTILGVLFILGGATYYVWTLSGLIGLDRKSRVAALMCGSQKTLAVGLPLSVMIFGSPNSSVELSLLIVPLLLYHPAQLILGGWLSPRLERYVANGKDAVGDLSKND